MRNLTKEQQSSDDPKPFFIGVGLRKPHLPFWVPKEFYDLYPEEDIKLADNNYAPRNMPKVAYASWELQVSERVSERRNEASRGDPFI